MRDIITSYRLTLKDQQRWDKLLANAVFPSYRASMAYQYSKEINDREIATFIFQLNGKDISGVHYSLKGTKFGIVKTSDVLSGIIFTEVINPEILSYILQHYIDWSRQNKASYLRFSPWIPDSIDGETNKYPHFLKPILQKYGFVAVNAGRHTYWLDLNLSEDELLGRMNPKTRYDIRHGIRTGLKSVRIDKPDNHSISSFWDLYCRLGTKKKFNILSEKKFKDTVFTLLDARLASLFITSFKEETVNISMASRTGIASYMFGAVNPDFKKIDGCPPPGHFAQWGMIKTLKSIGLKIYDLGFCPGTVPYKKHASYDIWRFKYGFGGRHVQFMPTYGKVLRPITGRIFQYLRYKK